MGLTWPTLLGEPQTRTSPVRWVNQARVTQQAQDGAVEPAGDKPERALHLLLSPQTRVSG